MANLIRKLITNLSCRIDVSKNMRVLAFHPELGPSHKKEVDHIRSEMFAKYGSYM